jgi:hypothetical protein
MSGIDLFVDTNILVNLAEGKKEVDQYLEGNSLFISVISEIELLGWHKITNQQKNFFQKLLNDCTVIGLINPIKELSIELRQKHRIKLPDAVIAASSIYLDIPLITQDQGFERIKNLNLVVIN